MEIVKAEILWTRKCSLHCSYCNMATGKENTLDHHRWIAGINNLTRLGCQFIAFYGAEPFNDFSKLPSIVGYAESQGIHTTVITSGAGKDPKEKMDILYDNGAKSITMSYDPCATDMHTDYKSSLAMILIEHWLKKPNIRDAALVTTLTRKNYHKYFTETVPNLSKKGIWSLFDIIHPDRGQPGSKCKNYEGIDNLLFSKGVAREMLELLQEAKQTKGLLLHASNYFLNKCRDHLNILTDYAWHCGRNHPITFPSWITIDCDGSIHPCDDFQSSRYGNVFIDDPYLPRLWEKLGIEMRLAVNKECPGCAWNTHIDAHGIKGGIIPISNYVHT